jgi:hypothetical protein
LSSPDPSTVMLPPSVSAAVRDLGLWRVRVLARTFYPDVAAAAASIALPLSVHTWLEPHGEFPVPIEHVERLQHLVAACRDSGSAMAAQGVTGRKPPFDQYKQFNALVDELSDLWRGCEQRDEDNAENLPADVMIETPLQILMRTQKDNVS